MPAGRAMLKCAAKNQSNVFLRHRQKPKPADDRFGRL
jgi:hypothetical protein